MRTVDPRTSCVRMRSNGVRSGWTLASALYRMVVMEGRRLGLLRWSASVYTVHATALRGRLYDCIRSRRVFRVVE